MTRQAVVRRPWMALIAPALLLVATGQARAQDSLTALLRRNAHPMQAAADRGPSGAGTELLLAAGRDAQFFLFGEEHGGGGDPAGGLHETRRPGVGRL